MSLIHVSGMDATLKTTICEKLSKKLNCPVVHFDKPKDLESGKNEYFTFLRNNDFTNKDIICDRFHDGEHIYAPIYRGYESNYLQEFESELKKVPYLFVNTVADLETIKKRIEVRGEDFVQEEHYQLVLDKFNEYLFKQSMPYIKIDTTTGEVKNYTRRILEGLKIVNKLFKYSVKNNLQNDYYGNIDAKYFFVSKDKNIKNILKEKGIYEDSWISTALNNEFNEYQFNLLKKHNPDLQYTTIQYTFSRI